MRVLLALALLLAACGGSSNAGAPTSAPPTEGDPSLALPVTAPVRAGKYLRDELDRQQAERDRRNADLESLLQPRDR